MNYLTNNIVESLEVSFIKQAFDNRKNGSNYHNTNGNDLPYDYN